MLIYKVWVFLVTISMSGCIDAGNNKIDIVDLVSSPMKIRDSHLLHTVDLPDDKATGVLKHSPYHYYENDTDDILSDVQDEHIDDGFSAYKKGEYTTFEINKDGKSHKCNDYIAFSEQGNYLVFNECFGGGLQDQILELGSYEKTKTVLILERDHIFTELNFLAKVSSAKSLSFNAENTKEGDVKLSSSEFNEFFMLKKKPSKPPIVSSKLSLYSRNSLDLSTTHWRMLNDSSKDNVVLSISGDKYILTKKCHSVREESHIGSGHVSIKNNTILFKHGIFSNVLLLPAYLSCDTGLASFSGDKGNIAKLNIDGNTLHFSRHKRTHNWKEQPPYYSENQCPTVLFRSTSAASLNWLAINACDNNRIFCSKSGLQKSSLGKISGNLISFGIDTNSDLINLEKDSSCKLGLIDEFLRIDDKVDMDKFINDKKFESMIFFFGGIDSFITKIEALDISIDVLKSSAILSKINTSIRGNSTIIRVKKLLVKSLNDIGGFYKSVAFDKAYLEIYQSLSMTSMPKKILKIDYWENAPGSGDRFIKEYKILVLNQSDNNFFKISFNNITGWIKKSAIHTDSFVEFKGAPRNPIRKLVIPNKIVDVTTIVRVSKNYYYANLKLGGHSLSFKIDRKNGFWQPDIFPFHVGHEKRKAEEKRLYMLDRFHYIEQLGPHLIHDNNSHAIVRRKVVEIY